MRLSQTSAKYSMDKYAYGEGAEEGGGTHKGKIPRGALIYMCVCVSVYTIPMGIHVCLQFIEHGRVNDPAKHVTRLLHIKQHIYIYKRTLNNILKHII